MRHSHNKAFNRTRGELRAGKAGLVLWPRRLRQTLSVGMRISRMAMEKASSFLGVSDCRARSAVPVSPRRASCQCGGSQVRACRPAGFVSGASNRKGRTLFTSSANRARGPASSKGYGRSAVYSISTDNKPLKYVPALSGLHRTRLRAPLSYIVIDQFTIACS